MILGLHMINAKTHYKHSNEQNLTFQKCGENEETTEHFFIVGCFMME